MLKGYRTVILTVVMTSLLVWRQFDPNSPEVSEEQLGSAFDAVEAALVAVWGLGALILRAVTDTPIGEGE